MLASVTIFMARVPLLAQMRLTILLAATGDTQMHKNLKLSGQQLFMRKTFRTKRVNTLLAAYKKVGKSPVATYEKARKLPPATYKSG